MIHSLEPDERTLHGSFSREFEGDADGHALTGLSELELTTPIAHAPAGWITLGLGDDAAYRALDAMLQLLGRRYGLSRRDALACASIHVDLRVTQMVNRVVGVHALLRAGAERTLGTAS